MLMPFAAHAANYALPLPEVNTLAGSFAELRPNHFHGGWDFRTGGKENLPVYAFADGYISHVVITPSGYGKMVMIDHPNGITTIYGHLNGFVGNLDSAVRREQFAKHSYDIQLDFPKGKFPVKAGQQFAWSGNTGGSAGPHLHFETRRTSDGLMLNPYKYNSVFNVLDNENPTIYGIKIYGLPGAGGVNGIDEKKYLVNAGRATTLRQGSTVRAWGKLAFAVKASDKMTGTYFNYGIRKYRLYLDHKLVSEIHLENFLFADKRAVNSLIDFKQRALSKEFYVRFSRDPGNPLSIYSHMVGNGTLTINEEGKNVPVTVEVEDDFGHKDSFSFIIRGEKQSVAPAPSGYTQMLKRGRPNTFSRKSILLNFPADALYTDVPLYFKMDTTQNLFSTAYDFGTDYVPIHTKFDVSVKVDRDTLRDKNKYVLATLNDKNQVTGVVPAKYIKGYMVGEASYLCRLGVYKDVTPPTIGTEHILKLRKFPVMKLKIRDNLSGIDTYNGYIDGKWVLFEYDPKTARILCDLRRAGLAEGRNHKLHVVVTDACGNKAVLDTSIYY